MSLYHETAEILTAPSSTGSLKSRIFKKETKAPPAQIYALAIETCKWSPVLKEVVEAVGILRLERKVSKFSISAQVIESDAKLSRQLTPILSILLVHDLLLAKKGIALPATHGLRSSVERHKARVQAEFTKARIRRKIGTPEAFKLHVEQGLETTDDASTEAPYPRWVRINTLKTTVEDQLESTFAGLEHATSIKAVRSRKVQKVFIDANIPNLLAVSPSMDLSRSEAYKSGAIIFQDKASCFPAYLLDPLPEDGDIIDSCSAPGNKTTHLASIMLSHAPDQDDCRQTIHAFEKNKGRAETLEKMVNLAGSHTWTKLHPGHDFLKADPESAAYKNVGALLLDPSCSGSGIVGRDDMPELHLPILKQGAVQSSRPHKKGGAKVAEPAKDEDSKKRKREDEDIKVMVDDDGEVTAVNTEDELRARLAALSEFQTQLLVHAFKFPAARKITYSTCSIHADENEMVVQKALESPVAKEKGWRLQKRDEQIRGMREWPVRGSSEACDDATISEACIRANKGDEHGTMGFFLAGFVRDTGNAGIDSSTFVARNKEVYVKKTVVDEPLEEEGEEEWGGFGGEPGEETVAMAEKKEKLPAKASKPIVNRHAHGQGKRPQLVGMKTGNKRRKA